MNNGEKTAVKLYFISFTRSGMCLAEKTAGRLAGYEAFLYTKYKGEAEKNTEYLKEDLKEWAGGCFREKVPLIFIGACGIAVRTIAPFLKDKLSDIPVLVMDEKGAFVIPVLSGHYGGANELAERIAEAVGAVAVITTATDVNHRFAVDVFAKKNGFVIANRENIARVSGKILEQKITMQLEGAYEGKLPGEIELIETGNGLPDVLVAPERMYEETPYRQILHLIPKVLVLGMGCRKGKSPAEAEQFVLQHLAQWKLPMEAVAAVATLDIKKEEPALLQLAEKYQLDFVVYSAEKLQQIQGVFSSSSFVKQHTGVDNVCERAALQRAGKGGRLRYRKVAENGMTLAVAECGWRAEFDDL